MFKKNLDQQIFYNKIKYNCKKHYCADLIINIWIVIGILFLKILIKKYFETEKRQIPIFTKIFTWFAAKIKLSIFRLWLCQKILRIISCSFTAFLHTANIFMSLVLPDGISSVFHCVRETTSFQSQKVIFAKNKKKIQVFHKMFILFRCTRI